MYKRQEIGGFILPNIYDMFKTDFPPTDQNESTFWWNSSTADESLRRTQWSRNRVRIPQGQGTASITRAVSGENYVQTDLNPVHSDPAGFLEMTDNTWVVPSRCVAGRTVGG
jgi:hypothetical protein